MEKSVSSWCATPVRRVGLYHPKTADSKTPPRRCVDGRVFSCLIQSWPGFRKGLSDRHFLDRLLLCLVTLESRHPLHVESIGSSCLIPRGMPLPTMWPKSHLIRRVIRLMRVSRRSRWRRLLILMRRRFYARQASNVYRAKQAFLSVLTLCAYRWTFDSSQCSRSSTSYHSSTVSVRSLQTTTNTTIDHLLSTDIRWQHWQRQNRRPTGRSGAY